MDLMDRAAGSVRLGVFGGSFDPLHVGHLAVAQDVLEALDLDRVLFVPARRSPHKSEAPHASGEHRLRMVRDATRGDPRFEVSGMELRREEPSFTVDTLRELAKERPGARLFLILGADQWAGFGRWHQPREITRLAELVVMSREGDRPTAVDPGLENGDDGSLRAREVSVVRLDVSSTHLRRRIFEGRTVRYLVPDPVRRIIERENLYSQKSP